jgi:hypothetical protein
MEVLKGIIQKDASVKCENGDIYHLPSFGLNIEGYLEVLVDGMEMGGHGSFSRQSIKDYIGMKVGFASNKKGSGFNYTIYLCDECIIINKINEEIYKFDNSTTALNFAIEKNKKDENHPKFSLHELILSKNEKKYVKIAELHREFGSDKFFWKHI